MSADARVSGRIWIDPPITWAELVDNGWALDRPTNPDWPDAIVKVDTTVQATSDGEVRHHTGVAIVASEWEQSARTLTADVARIVSQFATAPDGTKRTFTGFLHVVWGGGEDVYRVHVVNGGAVESYPKLWWPDGARDEDGAP